jgi:hypothetical protein
VSLLNVAVFSTVYFSGPTCPTANDINDDAFVPADDVISDFNSIPAFADSGVPILAGGVTYWTVHCTVYNETYY